jgi:predicted DNA-binding transcriptional regulator AlpA
MTSLEGIVREQISRELYRILNVQKFGEQIIAERLKDAILKLSAVSEITGVPASSVYRKVQRGNSPLRSSLARPRVDGCSARSKLGSRSDARNATGSWPDKRGGGQTALPNRRNANGRPWRDEDARRSQIPSQVCARPGRLADKIDP